MRRSKVPVPSERFRDGPQSSNSPQWPRPTDAIRSRSARLSIKSWYAHFTGLQAAAAELHDRLGCRFQKRTSKNVLESEVCVSRDRF